MSKKETELIINEWQAEIDRLKLQQQTWGARKLPQIAQSLRCEAFGIRRCIDDLKQKAGLK